MIYLILLIFLLLLNILFYLRVHEDILAFENNVLNFNSTQKVQYKTKVGVKLNYLLKSFIERINFLENSNNEKIRSSERVVIDCNKNLLNNPKVYLLESFRKLSIEREKLTRSLEVSSNKEKTNEFILSAVSHDVRSPLSNIELVFSLLNNETLDLQTKRLVEIGVENCKLLNSQIADILDYLRFEKDCCLVSKSNFSLNSILKEVLFNLKLKIDGSNCKILSSFEEDVFICADKNQIVRALTNLLNNSITHSANGTIQISLEAGFFDTKEFVVLKIKDSGKGIEQEKLTAIFEPFKSKDKDNPESVGLGMYISKKFLELNDAKLEVKSELGIGTTFEIRWVVEKGSQASAPNATKLSKI